ncbi:hypothetical protein UMZ34_13085 [Halopseudomonas pachastrellae]|nr:hypothetical protein UMZ34_13085 [Halopseudomonas pachastrellae]
MAFTLLAAGLRWPDAAIARRAAAVGRCVVVVGGVGVALTVWGVGLWSQIVPGLSALVIVWTALQQRRALAIVGALLLVGSFAVAATGKPGTCTSTTSTAPRRCTTCWLRASPCWPCPGLSAQADASAPPA